MNRRKFLVNTGIVGAGLLGTSSGASAALRSGTTLNFASNLKLEEKPVAFTVPPLPYAFDALEPYIDAKTMEIHHDKHHGAYVTNLNKALDGHADLQAKSLEDLLKRAEDWLGREFAQVSSEIQAIHRERGVLWHRYGAYHGARAFKTVRRVHY